jgi:hypothetical protein
MTISLAIPTVGQIVHFYPHIYPPDAPQAAIVTAVHSRKLVNLAVFNNQGTSYGAINVTVVHDGDTPPDDRYCTQMPYSV